MASRSQSGRCEGGRDLQRSYGSLRSSHEPPKAPGFSPSGGSKTGAESARGFRRVLRSSEEGKTRVSELGGAAGAERSAWPGCAHDAAARRHVGNCSASRSPALDGALPVFPQRRRSTLGVVADDQRRGSPVDRREGMHHGDLQGVHAPGTSDMPGSVAGRNIRMVPVLHCEGSIRIVRNAPVDQRPIRTL